MKICLFSSINYPGLSYVLQACSDLNIRIDSVIFDSIEFSSKNKKIWKERTNNKLPGIPLYALERELTPFFFIENHSSEFSKSLIKLRNIDIIVNVGTPRILPEYILLTPKIGVLNIHPGVLPHYRGCTSVEWAIYNDEPVGNTAHFMSKGIDEGPIISIETYLFKKSDNYSNIRTYVYRKSFSLIARTLRDFIDKKISKNDLIQQKSGTYRHVIDDKRMSEVRQKLLLGRYRYQNSI